MQEGRAADQVPRKGVLSLSVGLASREAAGPLPLCQVLQSLEFRPGFCLEWGRAQLLSFGVWQQGGETWEVQLLDEIGGVAAGRPGDRSQ